MLATKNVLERSSIKNLPVIYQNGKPISVLVDITVFEIMVNQLEKLGDEALFSDPEVVMQLKEAREDHLAGRITSHADLMRELGVEDEL